MEWLKEHCWPAVVLGMVWETACVLLLVQTRQTKWAVASMVGTVIIFGGIYYDFTNTTPREAITEMLSNLSDALERNQPDQVLAFVLPDRADLRNLARQQLERVTISKARVSSDLEVTPDNESPPRTARATFTGVFAGSDRRSQMSSDMAVYNFDVQLVARNGRWFITDCRWQPGTKAMSQMHH